jgi:hypothetical protein
MIASMRHEDLIGLTPTLIKFLKDLNGMPCEVGGALGTASKTDCYAMMVPYLEFFGRSLAPYTSDEIEDYFKDPEALLDEAASRLMVAGCESIPSNFQFFGDILRVKIKDEFKDLDHPNHSFFAIDSGNANCFVADVGHVGEVSPFKQKYLDILAVYRP